MSGEETIADIVADMRESCARLGCHFNDAVSGWASRIEAAHKREVDAVTASCMLRDKERGEEIERLRAEVERLRNGARCDWNSNRCGSGCLVFDDNIKLTARVNELREEVERLRAALGQEEGRTV